MQPETVLYTAGEAPMARKAGLSADMIKLIAIVAMVIDHAANVYVANYYSLPGVILHGIGRITGPVMFFFIAEGYRYTRNANRYTLRLGLFALVSYLPFIYFKTGSLLPTAQSALQLNVIYTLFLGHLAVRARHELQNPLLKLLAIALLFMLSMFGDWGYLCILFVLLFDIFHGNFAHQAAAYSAVVLTQIFPNLFGVLQAKFIQPVPGADLGPVIGYVAVMCCMFLPLILLYFYNGKKGNMGQFGKWMFYIFYPLHLLVLGALQQFGG